MGNILGYSVALHFGEDSCTRLADAGVGDQWIFSS